MAVGRRSKSFKQRAKSRNKVGTSIESLPKEVMTTVLALIASKSLTDLINAKLSCKYLLQISDDDFIFEKASMDKFSIFPWWNMTKQVSRFLKRCEESGNPEWLYILGLYEYFSVSKTSPGLNYLKRAADKGHVKSSYVYSIILICSGGELKQHGLKLLASLKRFRTREFRMKIRENFRWMWTRNMITINIEAEDLSSRGCDCLKNWNGGRWEGEDAAVPCCDSCFCHREVMFFSELIWSHYFLFKQ
ncbi:hypothetical protein Patl1_16878 [Pistacia atlantica]|uniref:Uncharacterized protein n=1 Tax=Pistacia atlantica TaxID=434234 RepID=A0ACC1BB78_9ROSI|nr:hypothetical protein Patl1_16878 [Pistacia atlantica]